VGKDVDIFTDSSMCLSRNWNHFVSLKNVLSSQCLQGL